MLKHIDDINRHNHTLCRHQAMLQLSGVSDILQDIRIE